MTRYVSVPVRVAAQDGVSDQMVIGVGSVLLVGVVTAVSLSRARLTVSHSREIKQVL